MTVAVVRAVYEAVLARIIELEYLALLRTVNSVGLPFHTQVTFPYWIHRPGAVIPVRDSESADVRSYDTDFIMRCVWGHLSAEYRGHLEADAIPDAAQIVAYFDKHDMLIDTEAVDTNLHTPPRYLAPIGCEIVSQPLGYFNVNGVWQIATEFTLTATLTVNANEGA